jgi:putative peptide zinc metalloprotease protein
MPAREFSKLRTDLTWRRFISEGQDSYIFKDEITQEYVKLDAISGSIALKLDGMTSPEDILAWARENWTSLDFDADYIADVLADLKRFKFLEDPFQRNAMLQARAHEERAQINATTFKNLLSIPIGTVNPDRFLTRTYPFVRPLFTPGAVAIWTVMTLVSLYLVATNHDHMPGGSVGMYVTRGLTPLGFLLLCAALVFTIVVHELGHGYAVKHFGGNVSKMGFLAMFFLPAMFCDTSDSHLLPNWKQRACVALAGTYAELYVATAATLVWWLTPTDLGINLLAYNVVIFASLSGVAFNYNPFAKYDGYFVLSDVLDQPNLQEDAFRYLGYLAKRYLLRRKDERSPVDGRRRKWVLTAYAVGCIGYTAVFGTLVFLLLRKLLIHLLAFLGALLAALLLLFVIRRFTQPLLRSAQAWALDHRGQIRRHQLPILAGISLLLAAFFLLPMPGRTMFDVALAPIREAALVAPEDLTLRQASWSAGQAVAKDQVLAVLDAQRAAAQGGEQAAAAGALRIQGGVAQRAGDVVGAVAARAAATAADRRSLMLGRRVERSELRAPFAGRVLTPAPTGAQGARFEAGDTLCRIGDFSSLRAIAWLPEYDVEDIEVGSSVRVRLRARPGELLHGQVLAIQSFTDRSHGSRRAEVRIALTDRIGDARSGLTGRAWVATPWRTPAAHVARALARFVRLDLWV